jgi:hypothetical protein
MNMARALKNPNPVVMSHNKAKQVADQLKGPAFCQECEQMFSKKGEKWVLANIPSDQGNPFPLQGALIPQNPVFIGGEINLYAGTKIKAFQMDQLIYFGMSIFWRGAAREWKSSLGAIAPPVDLGKYYEPIREFLLGAPFPHRVAILIYVYERKPAMNTATTVLPGKDQTGAFFWFYLNGLGFKLYLGNQIPENVAKLCAYSPEGFVIVDRTFGRMVREFLKNYLSSHELSPKLHEFVKGPDPRKK